MDKWGPVDWWFFATGAVLAPCITAAIVSAAWNARRRREFNRWADELDRQHEEDRKRREERDQE